MTEQEFKALAAQGYNRIALVAQAFADLETPLSLYLKLTATPGKPDDTGGRRYSFLLESVVGGAPVAIQCSRVVLPQPESPVTRTL